MRKARLGLGLRQEDLARILGNHLGSISRYENGHEDIPQSTAVAILYMVTYGLLEGLLEGQPVWRLPG